MESTEMDAKYAALVVSADTATKAAVINGAGTTAGATDDADGNVGATVERLL